MYYVNSCHRRHRNVLLANFLAPKQTQEARAEASVDEEVDYRIENGVEITQDDDVVDDVTIRCHVMVFAQIHKNVDGHPTDDSQ